MEGTLEHLLGDVHPVVDATLVLHLHHGDELAIYGVLAVIFRLSLARYFTLHGLIGIVHLD